jgi:hypothetical protein
VLGVPIGTVTSRLARAREQLQALLSNAEASAMTFSDDRLMAYVDRELDAGFDRRDRRRHRPRPGLAAARRAPAQARRAVHAAFEPILQEPMPKRLLDAASGTAPVSSSPRTRRWTWFEWSAMAASVRPRRADRRRVHRRFAPCARIRTPSPRWLQSAGTWLHAAGSRSRYPSNSRARRNPMRVFASG